MIRSTGYRFLRQDQQDLLCQTAHRAEREIFLDCLAALHDLALTTGRTGGHAAMSVSEVEAIFRRTLHWNSPPLDALRHNLEINREMMAELPPYGTDAHIDRFADAVIRQYQMLNAVESAASATSRSFS